MSEHIKSLNEKAPEAPYFRYIIYDTVNKPVFYGEMDPNPWTYERLCRERAWFRDGQEPAVLGIDRSGLMATIESLATATMNLGCKKEQLELIYEKAFNNEFELVNDILLVELKRHDEEVIKQIKMEAKEKKLALLAQLVTAIPELKETPIVQGLIESAKAGELTEQFLPTLQQAGKLTE